MDRAPSFAYLLCKELAPGLAQEEGHLLERDFRRTEEFWDQFCSQPSGYLVAGQIPPYPHRRQRSRPGRRKLVIGPK